MTKPFLSIIIPAYNEEKRLPLTLIDIDRCLSQKDYSYEIIVLNDGSIDSTAEIVRRFESIIKNLRLIDNQENRGQGSVVRQGMLSAKGNWRLVLGAHNAVSIDEFDKVIPHRDFSDIVIGSRGRRILGNVGDLILHKLILKNPWDINCNFKCFSEDAANRIFRLARVNRSAFNVEVLALANLLDFKIKEIPVRWVSNRRFRMDLKSFFSTIFDLAKIWWWLKRGKYSI